MRAGELVTKFSFDMVRHQPYYGNVLLRLQKATASETVETAAAGPDYILYNPDFLEKLMEDKVKGEGRAAFVMMHELLHIVLLHPVRREGRNKDVWNIAADLVDNHIIMSDDSLMSMGLYPPEDICICKDKNFIASHTTETLYDELYRQYLAQGGPEKTAGEYTFKLGKSNLKTSIVEYDLIEKALNGEAELTEGDPLRAAIDNIRDILGSAVPSGLGPAAMLKKEWGEFFGKRIKWYNYVKHFLQAKYTDDESFDSPSKNFLWQDRILPGPSLEENDMGEVLLLIDTSGSIQREDLSEFLFHFNDICTEFDLEGRVLLWEVGVKKDLDLETFIRKPDIVGGGGNNYTDVVNYINSHYRDANLAVNFTDGFWTVPEIPCKIPQLFVINEENEKYHLGKELEKYGKVCYYTSVEKRRNVNG